MDKYRVKIVTRNKITMVGVDFIYGINTLYQIQVRRFGIYWNYRNRMCDKEFITTLCNSLNEEYKKFKNE